MRSIIVALLLLISPALAHAAQGKNGYNTSPPQPLPASVETSIYLWKIENIDEKNQTFTAYIYLDLKWRDPRLAFAGESGKPMIFTEDSIDEKFKEIWWPETDFVNSLGTTIHNRSLSILPDGQATYSLKLNGTFFTPMDFKKFPFDDQTFKIRLQSFLWPKETLQFEIDQKNSGFAKDTFLDLFYLVSTSMNVTTNQYLDTDYSELDFCIHLERHTGFYIYQVLIPLFVILAITFAMFYIDVSELSSRLYLVQGSVLVLIAMKFMINDKLPPIDYLTIIDYIFFSAYFCCAIATAIACVHYRTWRKKSDPTAALSEKSIWIPIFLFFIMYLLIFYFILSGRF